MTSRRPPIGACLILLADRPSRELFGPIDRFSRCPEPEAMMKKLGLMPLIAATMMVSATVSFAQNNSAPANAAEHSSHTPQNSSSGTAPENMGATAWTGGSRGQTKDSATTTKQTTPAQDAEAAKDQPEMASGEDLKGPPEKFPPYKTPE
jgi:predicted membrane-bound mannosyltransferase